MQLQHCGLRVRSPQPFASQQRVQRPRILVQPIRASKQEDVPEQSGRRELLLNSSSALVLASIFNFGGSRPKSVGLKDYGEGNKQLGLCPRTPNCISTAEAANDDSHYVPPWTYNPAGGRGTRTPATKEQAMAELKEVVSTLKPDKFEPKIVAETGEYLYVEYKSPLLGFVDDVEFYFSGRNDEVEYRSASRVGESDFDINRKRIRAIRKELEKKGWRSVGF